MSEALLAGDTATRLGNDRWQPSTVTPVRFQVGDTIHADGLPCGATSHRCLRDWDCPPAPRGVHSDRPEKCVSLGAVTRLNWVRPRFGGEPPTMRVCRVSRPDVDVLFGEDVRTDPGKDDGLVQGALSINETESLIAPAPSIDVARYARKLKPSSQILAPVCAWKGFFDLGERGRLTESREPGRHQKATGFPPVRTSGLVGG